MIIQMIIAEKKQQICIKKNCVPLFAVCTSQVRVSDGFLWKMWENRKIKLTKHLKSIDFLFAQRCHFSKKF